MAQLDALKMRSVIRERLVELALDETFVRDEELSKICHTLWSEDPPERGGLVSDIWVEAAFPAKFAEGPQRRLSDLVAQGLFDKDLADHLDRPTVFPKDRILYAHQLASVLAAQPIGDKRPAIVTTASTGAGKTECFLLPVLNQLCRTPRRDGSGVRCIILYPMNALVNDQVDRLYNWLQRQDRVTLFHFTSETPEHKDRFFARHEQLWDRCRFNTRQHARGLERVDGKKLVKIDIDNGEPRGKVPDILITNYSMLEYMLCRPQDAAFFGSALEAIVLDEAHLYSGTLAAEITLLLRRITDRCGVSADDVLHIATSATLGKNTLRTFIETIFSKDPSLVRQPIEGELRREQFPVEPSAKLPRLGDFAAKDWLKADTLQLDDNGAARFTAEDDDARWNSLCDDLRLLASETRVSEASASSGRVAARLLHAVLRRSPLAQRLADVLHEHGRVSLPSLAKLLWGDDSTTGRDATLKLLRMAAAARCGEGDYPLVPHRLHLLMRVPEGLCACLNPQCNAAEGKLPGLGRVIAGYEPRCPSCSSPTLSLYRCGNCGEPAIAGHDIGFKLQAVKPSSIDRQDDGFGAGRRITLLVSKSHGVRFDKDFDKAKIYLRAADGAICGLPKSDVTLFDISEPAMCPNCGEQRRGQTHPFVPFTCSTPLALSVLAETILAELPEYGSSLRRFLPARGRRLLAFTDGRQGAAKLGPRLTSQHERQVLRAALADGLPDGGDPETIAYLESEREKLTGELASPTLPTGLRSIKQKQLGQVDVELLSMRDGKPVPELIAILKSADVFAELIDLESAEDHHAPWTKQQWADNWASILSRLPQRVKTELARPFRGARVGGLESLGLIEIVYPGIEKIAAPNGLVGAFEPIEACWTSLLRVFCDTLRGDGAVTLGSDNEDQEYDVGGAQVGDFMDRARFIGALPTQRRRRLVSHILKARGISEPDLSELTNRILGAAWDALRGCVTTAGGSSAVALPWIEAGLDDGDDGLRINLDRLTVRRPPALLRSRSTGHVFSHAVPYETQNGTAFAVADTGCTDLEATAQATLDGDARLGRRRRDLRKALFRMGLWAEEHTAQLSPDENRRLQDLFKCGGRNILSSTTTLELGIDIGGLSCAFLTDVPPRRASYLQRAGRAGRRADGSSLVTTFARKKPFDRHVFREFDWYLAQPLRDPNVFLDRKRIAERHANAFLLGEFFRRWYPVDAVVGAMDAFRNMGDFCGAALPVWWNDEPRRPGPSPAEREGIYRSFCNFVRDVAANANHEVRPRLKKIMTGCSGISIEDDVSMTAFLIGVPNALSQQAIEPWQQDYEPLFKSWSSITDPDQKRIANAICKSCEALYSVTTIEALADAQFLPRYGFPIGVLPLRVYDAEKDKRGELRVREEDQYRLERPGLLALREYTPGQTVIAGGKVIRSRGLLKHWTGTDLDQAMGLNGVATKCSRGHFHYRRDGKLPHVCPDCGEPLSPPFQYLLFPKYGFSSAWWDQPKRAPDSDPIGTVQVATTAFVAQSDDERRDDFAGISGLQLHFREGGKLLVYNPGFTERQGQETVAYGFAICTACGFAQAEDHHSCQGIQHLPANFSRHRPLRRVGKAKLYRCWRKDQTPVIRNRVLASEQVTDIIMLDFSNWAILAGDAALRQTLAVAFRLGGAALLQLDSRELGSMIVPCGNLASGVGIVLYDNHPGGAGHVLELAKFGPDWFAKTLKDVLWLDEPHHEKCESACLRCLLTFDSPPIDPDIDLVRRHAHQFLSRLMGSDTL